MIGFKFFKVRCWSGGSTGRKTLERLLPIVPDLLTSHGLFYIVALHSNDIPYLLNINPRLRGEIVCERRCGIEHLYILKYKRL